MSKTTPPKARQAKKKSSTSPAQKWGEPINPFLPPDMEQIKHELGIVRSRRLPSQVELATLAAALDSPNQQPAATAARALAVWQACGEALEISLMEQEYARERMARFARKGFSKNVLRAEENFANGRITAPEHVSVSLQEFLKRHFSENSKSDHMQKKFRDFLRDKVMLGSYDLNFDPDDLSPEALEKLELDAVGKAMQCYREYGVPGWNLKDLSLDFEDFLQRQKEEMEIERARKGGIARREKAEKSPKKTPQRKKTLGSKKPGPKQKKAERKQ